MVGSSSCNSGSGCCGGCAAATDGAREATSWGSMGVIVEAVGPSGGLVLIASRCDTRGTVNTGWNVGSFSEAGVGTGLVASLSGEDVSADSRRVASFSGCDRVRSLSGGGRSSMESSVLSILDESSSESEGS